MLLNIQTIEKAENEEYCDRRNAYLHGHRDARHAAAELANTAESEFELLREENKALREALMRLRRWGMGGSFHAGVVGDIQDWIDSGMTGELPEYPNHLPPIKADPAAALAEIAKIIDPEGQAALAQSEHLRNLEP